MGVLDNNYEVIIISETWLNNSMNSEEFFPSNYIVYRKDRYDFITNLRGGGVLIAVKNTAPSEMIACHSSLDIISVRVNLGNRSVVCIGVYALCGSNLEYYKAITAFIDSAVIPFVRADEHLIIVGDFNLPNITWFDVGEVFTSSSTDEKANTILDYCAGISTTQLNRYSNSRGNFLDLLFSNEVLFTEVSSCEDFTGCSSVHHTPITINIFVHRICDSLPSNNNSFFNFSNADYTSLNEFLTDCDWTFLQRGMDLNAAVLLFHKLISTGIGRYVPLVEAKSSFREPWFNSRLVILEKQRNKLHTLYRKYGAAYYPAFASARKEFKNLNWFLFNNYVLRIENELTTNPKMFWRFLNNKRKVSGFPSPMSYQNSIANDPADICNLFAKFFSSVFEPVSSTNGELNGAYSSADYIHVRFTEAEVRDSLLNLDVNKGSGHDGLPPILFRNCAESLATPIAFLFNESLRIGTFPDPWKTSIVHPIFKSGNRNEISNYRGITILSVLPKLFESMVHKFLSYHIRQFIAPEQHGFFPGRSTVTNLVTFCADMFKCINSKRQLDVLYTDFSKAFDKIDHSILAAKLENLDCEFIPTKWLASYLSNRWLYVNSLGSSSQKFRATSGVPQGSHVGPLLFLIFINDVTHCFKFARCLMFADDLKIFAEIADVSDCQLLQEDLNRFCNWSINNKLLLNVSKCKTLTFYRSRSMIIHHYFLDDILIDRVEYLTDLGVIFSCDLTFSKHIDYIVNRASIMLGFIKRNCVDFCDPITLKMLFVAFVRSVLEYASPVWAPFYKCHSDRIESVQKQFVLYALRRLPHNRVNQFDLPPYQDRCNLLTLQRLDHRRLIASAVFVRDLLTARIDCDVLLARLNIYAPERCLRRRGDFLQFDAVSTNYGLSEPVLNMSRIFNSTCPVFDLHISRDSFKNVLRNLLITSF